MTIRTVEVVPDESWQVPPVIHEGHKLVIRYEVAKLIEAHPVLCPFSLLNDFERWFDWHKRVYFYQEDKLAVCVNMLGIGKQLSIAVEERFLRKVMRPDWDRP